MEPIYNIEALIYELEKVKKRKENEEVYIRDLYSTGEYLRISGVWVDDDEDIIIDVNIN